jgi:hypothetical protein
MALTEEQVDKALKWVIRKAKEDGVRFQDIVSVIKWMIENPLPSKAEYLAQTATWEAEDKEVRRAHLQEELDKLN